MQPGYRLLRVRFQEYQVPEGHFVVLEQRAKTDFRYTMQTAIKITHHDHHHTQNPKQSLQTSIQSVCQGMTYTKTCNQYAIWVGIRSLWSNGLGINERDVWHLGR